ncbi:MULTISPECIES: NUDIX hydrolase [unclassified Microbacterium]|uniref:NUDIX hydrolase n=1 Tax=unclassified Microbacterium TaxID=2609290 RepID=UPI00214CEF56|nr:MULTISPECIES: NUDIX hydrolase [unclassified Microbacterium]MCR2810185.1 NUDIX hydrolase [Microbacterium sp. zg.B185]WIM19981.1 NUDIX hydrolase [Microbacterium sp. zg-B185]
MPEPTSSDRAVQALEDVTADTRPRLPGDGTDPHVPVAATVVIVRDRPAGPEILMIERPDRGSFAGAWVFPGGKLEDADRAAAHALPSRPTAWRPRPVADEGTLRATADELAAAHHAGARETEEETGLRVDAASLVALSCWDPPPGIALRIRTWFFLALDPGGALTLAPDEVANARWVQPAEMLDRHGRGEVTLYPPTWVTLYELAAQPDAAAMLGMARMSGIRRFETVARRGGEGPMLLWQGDAAYHDAMGDAPSRHRLEMAALPWIYTRTD